MKGVYKLTVLSDLSKMCNILYEVTVISSSKYNKLSNSVEG